MKAVNTADFLFKEDLNGFLARPIQGEAVRLSFEKHQSVKHLIESLGVPHVEVGEILVNGNPVEGGYRPHDGDRIEVQPAPPACPIEPHFVLDNHLGRLTSYLRMLGFDCLYRNNYSDVELVGIIQKEPRILLSRDRRLLMRKVVQYGCCIRSRDPLEQLRQVMWRFELARQITPFQRCLRCNAGLEPVSKAAVLDRLEPKTKKYYNEFHICPSCNQVYWKGSHYERMLDLIHQI